MPYRQGLTVLCLLLLFCAQQKSSSQSTLVDTIDHFFERDEPVKAIERAFHQIEEWLVHGGKRQEAEKLLNHINSLPFSESTPVSCSMYRRYLNAFVKQEIYDQHEAPGKTYLELLREIDSGSYKLRRLKHRIYKSMVSSALVLNKLDSAVLFAQTAYQLGAELYGKNSCKYVHDCFILAYCLIETGQDALALPVAQEAILIAESCCAETSPQYIDAHRIMGYYYVKSNYQATRGVPFYQKALLRSLETKDADRAFKSLYYICRTGILSNDNELVNDYLPYFDTIGRIADDISRIKSEVARLDIAYELRVQENKLLEAIGLKLEFLNLLQNKLPERTTAAFDAYYSIIEKYIELHDKHHIQIYLQKLEEFASRNPLNNDQLLSYYAIKSTSLIELGEWESALHVAQRGIAHTAGEKWHIHLQNEEFDNIVDLYFYRKFVDIFALYYHRQHKNSASQESLKNEFDYLNQVVSSTIRMIERDDERLSIQKPAEIAYDFERLISCALKMHKQTKVTSYLTLAFQLTDMASNLTFFRGRQARQTTLRSMKSDSIITVKYQLARKLSTLNHIVTSNSQEQQQIKEQQLDLQLMLSRIDQYLAKEEPLYMSNIRAISFVDIKEVQAQVLDGHSAFIHFFYYDRLFALIALENKIIEVPIAIPPDFENILQEFQRISMDPIADAQTYYRVSRLLSKTIMDPIVDVLPKGINRICISPYGKLSNVSFESLVIEDVNQTTDFGQLPYLIKKYAISYAFSMAALLDVQKSSFSSPASLLAVAPTYSMPIEITGSLENQIVRDALLPLNGAKSEVNKIAKFIKNKQLLLGNSVNENIVQREMDKYSIWHFAMHATLDEEDAMRSSLKFPDEVHSTQRQFTAAELYQMDVRAHMVVLSACNTGVGTTDYTHGPMSLARAFSYSGAESTVLANWPAPDKAAAMFFPTFYGGLADGLAKDKAMQRAKVDWLQNVSVDQYQHPYYWNAFTLWGSTAAFESWERPSSIHPALFLILCGLGLILLVFVLKRFIRIQKKN